MANSDTDITEINKRDSIFDEIDTERRRQEMLVKEGKFLYTCASSEIDDKYKLAILCEEVGEVCKEVVELNIQLDKIRKFAARYTANGESDPVVTATDHYRALIRKELVQVAAVTVAWIESL